MKLFLMWLAAALWAGFWVWVSLTYFREAVGSDMGFMKRPESILSGIGSLTVGALALVGAGLIHRHHRRRRRGRLLKEKEKIERQLRRIDEREGRAGAPAAPQPPPAGEAAPGS